MQACSLSVQDGAMARYCCKPMNVLTLLLFLQVARKLAMGHLRCHLTIGQSQGRLS